MIKKEKKLFIFILSYNHRRTILNLLERIPKSVWDLADEILIADDCSKDDTVERAMQYKKDNKLKKLTIIRHEKNKGYGGNQKFCYNYAISKGYDIAVMVHGDLQYPPEYIEPLFNLFNKQNIGMAFGSRMSGDPLKGNMPLYKYLGNIFLTTTENIILGTRLTEFHSGFRAYSTEALKKIPFNKNSNDFHFDSEIIIQILLSNNKIIEIPIPTFYGNEKCNVNVIKYGFNILGIMGQYLLHKTNLRSYEKFNMLK